MALGVPSRVEHSSGFRRQEAAEPSREAAGRRVSGKLPAEGSGEAARAADRPVSVRRPGVSPSLLSEIQAVTLPLGIAFAALVAKVFYFDLILHLPTPVSFYLGVGILAAIVLSLIASQSVLHSTSAIVSGQLQSRLIIATVSLSFLLVLCLFYLLKVSDHFSRGWLVLWYGLSIAFLLLERFGILLWARLLRAESRLLQRVAVYGSVDLAERVLDKLFAHDRNLVLAGVFSDEHPLRQCSKPVTGGMRALIASAQSGDCDRVVLALPWGANDKIRDAIDSLEVLPIDVQLSPDARTLPCRIQGSQQAGGLVLLDLQRRPLSARGMLVKTVMDYVIGAAALAAFVPLMLAIAVAIKLGSRGPVFFVQSRHGYNHRIIRVIKFRTMTVAEDGPVVTQAVRGDERVTRIGRFLRRTSLDELPQLFNVMKGELSLVGPRPHAVTHNEAYEQILASYGLHKVKPGITGWAQVNGFRGETKTPEAMRQRVDLDLYYINHWSPWLDVEILARTAVVPFSSSDVY